MKSLRKMMLAVFACGMVLTTLYAKVMPQGTPESVGLTAEPFVQMDKAVQGLVDDEKIGGGITMIARKGTIVHFEAYGMRDIEAAKPMRTDTIMRFYSMSKPVTCAAAMVLVDQGKMSLDDPVSKHIKEFKGLKVFVAMDGESVKTEPCKREMTVRDLMTHTSGLTYGIFGNTPVDQMYRKARVLGSTNLDEMVKKLAEIPLLNQPGEKWHYGVSTDVLGAVIERISGQKLDAFFEEHIFKPLDMKDTGFYVVKSKQNRFSKCYSPDGNGGLKVAGEVDAYQFMKPTEFFSGGGGLVSTARDYMRFAQMLLNKGELYGVRVLSEKAVEAMTRNQLPDGLKWMGVNGFGLGGSVILEDMSLLKFRKGEYSWSGAASTHFWIIPQDDVVVLALTQIMPFSNDMGSTVRGYVYEAITANE